GPRAGAEDPGLAGAGVGLEAYPEFKARPGWPGFRPPVPPLAGGVQPAPLLARHRGVPLANARTAHPWQALLKYSAATDITAYGIGKPLPNSESSCGPSF